MDFFSDMAMSEGTSKILYVAVVVFAIYIAISLMKMISHMIVSSITLFALALIVYQFVLRDEYFNFEFIDKTIDWLMALI